MDEPTLREGEGRAPSGRVLVVEDSVDTARMMKLLLKKEGYDVRVALDGPEAIEVARSHRPDVTLLDLTLPSMGGEDVARAIREMPGLETSFLVAVSGYADGSDDFSSPFDHRLSKPLDFDALIDLLAAWTGLPTA